ncbi:hypothetical protein TIFTF001_005159 [Ficus carica]|uniref:Uncharacterized protein n=1 Tax=Ficus carica TaxID=3494 RepID=A0AA87ZMZ0_FICCA|nr:hypothetical protein TIFTF001_005159 [Ficus carica]
MIFVFGLVNLDHTHPATPTQQIIIQPTPIPQHILLRHTNLHEHPPAPKPHQARRLLSHRVDPRVIATRLSRRANKRPDPVHVRLLLLVQRFRPDRNGAPEKGCTRARPKSPIPSPSSGSPAAKAKFWAMLAPALSPAKNTRAKSA